MTDSPQSCISKLNKKLNYFFGNLIDRYAVLLILIMNLLVVFLQFYYEYQHLQPETKFVFGNYFYSLSLTISTIALSQVFPCVFFTPILTSKFKLHSSQEENGDVVIYKTQLRKSSIVENLYSNISTAFFICLFIFAALFFCLLSKNNAVAALVVSLVSLVISLGYYTLIFADNSNYVNHSAKPI